MKKCELKNVGKSISGNTIALIVLSALVAALATAVAVLLHKLFGKSDDYDFDDFDIDDDEDDAFTPDSNEFFAEDNDFEG